MELGVSCHHRWLQFPTDSEERLLESIEAYNTDLKRLQEKIQALINDQTITTAGSLRLAQRYNICETSLHRQSKSSWHIAIPQENRARPEAI